MTPWQIFTHTLVIMITVSHAAQSSITIENVILTTDQITIYVRSVGSDTITLAGCTVTPAPWNKNFTSEITQGQFYTPTGTLQLRRGELATWLPDTLFRAALGDDLKIRCSTTVGSWAATRMRVVPPGYPQPPPGDLFLDSGWPPIFPITDPIARKRSPQTQLNLPSYALENVPVSYTIWSYLWPTLLIWPAIALILYAIAIRRLRTTTQESGFRKMDRRRMMSFLWSLVIVLGGWTMLFLGVGLPSTFLCLTSPINPPEPQKCTFLWEPTFFTAGLLAVGSWLEVMGVLAFMITIKKHSNGRMPHST